MKRAINVSLTTSVLLQLQMFVRVRFMSWWEWGTDTCLCLREFSLIQSARQQSHQTKRYLVSTNTHINISDTSRWLAQNYLMVREKSSLEIFRKRRDVNRKPKTENCKKCKIWTLSFVFCSCTVRIFNKEFLANVNKLNK